MIPNSLCQALLCHAPCRCARGPHQLGHVAAEHPEALCVLQDPVLLVILEGGKRHADRGFIICIYIHIYREIHIYTYIYTYGLE